MESNHMFSRIYILVLMVLVFSHCKNSPTDIKKPLEPVRKEKKDTIVKDISEKSQVKKYTSGKIPPKYAEIPADTLGILLDLRYATENNFTKKQIYDCPRCFFREEVAEKILALHMDLKERYGFGIKLYDCYRPAAYQKKLWDIVPDPNYVTPPHKGSVHSRGMAVDLTIVDKKGKELDMGTPFDFFGKEAHTDYQDLPDNVLKNRQLLIKIMEIHGFKGIRTEWWHFSYRNLKGKIDNWVWACE